MRDDLELVSSILEGNSKSFEELVLKYEAAITRYLYNMIGDKQISEDLTQEIFILVYNKLYTFKQQYKFSSWLYQIAHNKCIDYIRKRNKEKIEGADIDVLSFRTKDMNPEELLICSETKASIEKFIKTLSNVDRQILVLRYVQKNLTFSDIAQILKMNESTVKKRYYKMYEQYEKFSMQKQNNSCTAY